MEFSAAARACVISEDGLLIPCGMSWMAKTVLWATLLTVTLGFRPTTTVLTAQSRIQTVNLVASRSEDEPAWVDMYRGLQLTVEFGTPLYVLPRGQDQRVPATADLLEELRGATELNCGSGAGSVSRRLPDPYTPLLVRRMLRNDVRYNGRAPFSPAVPRPVLNYHRVYPPSGVPQ